MQDGLEASQRPDTIMSCMVHLRKSCPLPTEIERSSVNIVRLALTIELPHILLCQSEMTNLIAPSFACSTLSCAEPLASKVYSVLRERHMRYCENCGQMPSECGIRLLGEQL